MECESLSVEEGADIARSVMGLDDARTALPAKYRDTSIGSSQLPVAEVAPPSLAFTLPQESQEIQA